MTSQTEQKRSFFGKLFSRALHSYFLMRRGLTLGVRAIVRSEDGKFLLVRHTYTPGWHLPGGGVEKGETAVAALENELLQETGLQLEGEPLFHGVFHNNGVSRRDHVLVYVCNVNGSVSSKSTSVEIAEIGYFDFNDLPEGTDPGTIRRMREVVEGAEPRLEW
ncbi:NUDIX domain-containing protein [Tritonibacter mobilis]|uniref:NUDIX domain-containing protein n=1 Tax=Tritonibacter mobilis TaxID=379347 RepID=UPI0014036BD9|nr:NUDIX domain-containing protein [Tritonibacter mobilis]NHM17534.1 NUDIX domain-containing protein [Tritonibacter mobilis]NHM21722.1 NUDIX domain-containing protein [Tritonibacter mobilis]